MADSVDDMPRGSETVLVVEDDELVRELVVELVLDLGYRVLSAENGEEARAILLHGDEIDLLFTDISLPPPLSGTELARAARARRPGLRVLLMTGDAKLASAAAQYPTVAKPFRRVELAQRLREALES